MTCFHVWCGFEGRHCDECAPDAAKRPQIAGIAALKIGKAFLAACNSAWASGDAPQRVKTMLDMADKFEAALTDYFAHELEPALCDGAPAEQQKPVAVAEADQALPIGDAETVQVDDRSPSEWNSELVVEGHTSSCLACVRRAERNMPPRDNHQELREAISTAITKADDAFGYSYRMTGLFNDVETHTLFMDGFEPVSFENRDDGDRLIAERRNRLRADAIVAALSPQALPAPGEGEDCPGCTGDDPAWSGADCPTCDGARTLATVAAANDEGVAALQEAMTWHESEEKALSKQPPSADGNWRRMQHQEQIALLDAAIRLSSQGGGK